MKKAAFISLLLIALPFVAKRTVNLVLLAPPAGMLPASNLASAAVLPNGRFLTPRGRNVVVAAHPYGLTLSPDGKALIASCNGTEPFSISILRSLDEQRPQLFQIKADRERYRQSKVRDENDEEFRSVFMGLAVAGDNHTLYASSGNQGSIFIFDIRDGRRTGTISLNDRDHQNTFSGELALSVDGRFLYVLDQANYRVAIIDTNTRRVLESVPTGRAPFAISLTPDGKRLYVTNVGLFRYSVVKGYSPSDPKRTGLQFPPFGFPSVEAEKGVRIGGIDVPGLGDPRDDEAASVWGYEVESTGNLKNVSRTRTGRLIGQVENGLKVVGSSSPSGVAAGIRRIFVSNANNDTVTVVDRQTSNVVATVNLNIFAEVVSKWRRQGYTVTGEQERMLRRLRGQIPFGLTLSRDESRLYVAEAGINAVAVIDTRTLKVLGHIPTGWFPSQVRVSGDGKQLYVANAKGYGSGPNGGPGFTRGPEGTSVGALQKGVISIIDLPGDQALADETAQTIANNGFQLGGREMDSAVIPAQYGKPSDKIKYVVFITKENRTYDQIFGDVPEDSTGRKLRAEPGLAKYGTNSSVFDEHSKIALRNVNTTPNHHELVRRFASADNFYLDADVSADGHRWLVGVYPNAWVETSLAASYGGHRDFRLTPNSPGRLTYAGSAAALAPEDYLEAGSIWEHLFRSGRAFRNYGEGFELAGIEEDADYEPTGARLPVNLPMPQPLFESTAKDYPTFNMNVSDQFRVQQFEKDFTRRFIDGGELLPSFINIYLPNDHESRERPKDGYPYRASYVVDNDLALGRMIEFLSKTRYWKEMAIFVTEDDAQGGLDSVDAHRSLLMVVSPYARRGVSLARHTSIASILKTIFLILGMEPLNQYDAASADLREAFTATPDFTPYRCLEIDRRVFDETLAIRSKRASNGGATRLDDPADFEEEHERLGREARAK